MSHLPRSKSAALYAAYTKFEKQHGTKSTLETTVLGKRRIQYEDEVSQDGRNYDVWFDYARLEEGALQDLREEGAPPAETESATDRVREVYERAVAQVPPGGEKRHWRRYIFLWLNYALFEELETKVRLLNIEMQYPDSLSLSGLLQGSPNISNGAEAHTAQTIHVCEALAPVCPL